MENKHSLKGSRLWGVLLFAILVFIDQITKIVADVYFGNVPSAPESIAIIPGVIELTMEYNRGIAFSMFSGAGQAGKIAIVVGTALIMLAVSVVYFKIDKRRTLLRIALVLIVAGGVGNLIDRVYYQVWDPATATGFRDGVRDMVRVDFKIVDFGVCNFADFFISGGAVLFILSLLFFDKDAIFPVGEKYKALAKEAQEAEEKKKAEKEAKKSVNG
jgi:signal peptidase II